MSGDAKKKSKVLRVIGIAAALLILLVLVIPFLLDANQFRPQLESKLSTALGRDVKVGNLKLSLLSVSVAVDDISIADNPAFSRNPFVTAKSLNVGVRLKPLIFSKVIHVTGISLDKPIITLVRTATGKWNFSDLGSKSGTSKAKAAGQGTGGFQEKDFSIEKLKITGGRVAVVHTGRAKPSVYNDVSITASDLSFISAFPFSLTALLPGSGSLKLEGKAGPLNSEDLMATPLTAELEVRKFDMIASGFVPAGSGLAGLLDFDGTLDSNGRQVQSKGRAKAEKLQLVKGGSPAAEPVSLEYLMTYDLLDQNGALKNATVSFGKAVAQINGVYKTRGDSMALNMRLHGNNMPVQDLKALLPAFGVRLPKGASLEGGVLNANLTTEGPVESLVTSGNAELLKTRLVGFDLAGKMASLATLAGLKPDPQTEIEKFASGMRMTPDGIQVSGLQLIVPSLGELTGDGKVGADQALDFKMLAMLKPTGGVGLGLAQLFNKGGSTLNVPFFVRGTASEPRFIPDFKRASGGLLESALQGQGKKQGQTDTGKMLGDTLQNLFQKKK